MKHTAHIWEVIQNESKNFLNFCVWEMSMRNWKEQSLLVQLIMKLLMRCVSYDSSWGKWLAWFPVICQQSCTDWTDVSSELLDACSSSSSRRPTRTWTALDINRKECEVMCSVPHWLLKKTQFCSLEQSVCSLKTIRYILKRKEFTGELSSTKRPGGPQKTTKVDESRNLFLVKNSFTTSRALLKKKK